jgi:hypothetical protein
MSSIRPPQLASTAQGSAQAASVRGSGAKRPWQSLGFPGLILVLAGLALCGSFFLPWFSSSLACTDPVCSPPTMKDPHFLNHYSASASGFSIANGTFALTTTGPFGPIHESFSFLLLWVVFLAGLLLIVLPLLLALGKMDAGRTRTFFLVLSLVTLVIEVIYSINAAQALPQTKTGLASLLNALALPAGHQAVFDFSTGPAGGFWLALGATLVATGTSGYALASASGRRYNTGLLWRNMGLAGQVVLTFGLALIVAFFLPWFSAPGAYKVAANKTVTLTQSVLTSGWNTAANGLQTPLLGNGSCTSCLTPHVSIFLSLWLVPLAALGLVTITWMLGRGLLWRRMAAILACVTLLVALALETFFLLEVQSLQNYDVQVFQSAGQQLTSTAYSVAWGFWVTLALTGIALLMSGFLLLQRHKSVTGMPARP